MEDGEVGMGNGGVGGATQCCIAAAIFSSGCKKLRLNVTRVFLCQRCKETTKPTFRNRGNVVFQLYRNNHFAKIPQKLIRAPLRSTANQLTA
ncbi:uncharacterized [Tachysurus ichikawai]